MFQKWIDRRLNRIDQGRIDLFGITESERPVEAVPAFVPGLWPTALGMPVPPSAASEMRVALPGLVESFPFMSVLLLTESELHWCPNRTYKGGVTYRDTLDKILAENTDHDREAVYSRFDHVVLGPRSVPVSHITQVSLDLFVPLQDAIVTVHMADSWVHTEEHIWPIYDQMLAARVLEEATTPPGAYLGGLSDSEEASVFEFAVQGAASYNFGLSMSRAFRYLEIPVRTEELEDWEQGRWDELAYSPTRIEWRPLYQRLEA